MLAHYPSAQNPKKAPATLLVTRLIRFVLILVGIIIFFAISPPEIARSSPKLQQLTHDIAIIDVQTAVSSVNRGEVVKIDITAANLGTSEESFQIQLRDETDGKEADSVGVTVAAGQILALTLQWDTSGASPGIHALRAIADLLGDENPANNTPAPALTITVTIAEILLGDGGSGESPLASFGAGLIPPGPSAASLPNTQVFIGNQDASLSSQLNLVAVGTQPAGLASFFLANTDAEFGPEAAMRNPFLQGQLRGLTHLEGRPNSEGALVQVGDVAHRVQRDGRFNLLLPEGAYNISIWAPGYVAVNLPNVEIKSGQVLTVPELTLPFGDANGDGRIDIMDLSIAAGNFGATVQELQLP